MDTLETAAPAVMGLSLEDPALNLQKAGEVPFEFEVEDDAGRPLGIFLRVLGDQSPKVEREVTRLVMEARRQQSIREASVRPGKPVPPSDPRDDIALGKRLAACKLAGWRRPGQTDGLSAEQKARFNGIVEEFTPENALRLCTVNDLVSSQVNEHAAKAANFMRPSSTA